MKPASARQEAMDAFLEGSGWGSATRRPLPGDASTRHYTRLHLGKRTAMLMDQPQGAEGPTSASSATPAERRALGYNALARLAGADCARFVAVARYLRGRGLGAPEILSADTTHGFLLLEDLGDDLYTDVLTQGGDARALYGAAIGALVRLHGEAAPAELGEGKPLYAYDETAQLAEIDLLTEWFVPAATGRAAEAAQAEEHRALWTCALRDLNRETPVFVHRDYHAQNLLWRAKEDGLSRVGVIDFQDALAGSQPTIWSRCSKMPAAMSRPNWPRQ